MPKLVPNCPEKPSPGKSPERCYEIELITPMVGGGVETRVNDPSFPIRPTAIRGQLQFWWRATVGAQYDSIMKLRKEQSEVWGDTAQASRVQVQVTNVQAAEPKPCALIEWNQGARWGQGGWRTNWQSPFNGHDSALPYALFPFQGETPPPNRSATVTMPPAYCIHKATFRLTVTSHKDIDFTKQVEPALWAWVNFGGLGGRTRRGCGGIKCNELLAKDRNDLLVRLKSHLSDSNPKEWPTLAAAYCLGNEMPNALAAWNAVIKVFRSFRQGEGVGRNPGQQPNRPGRSRWPEPETIRGVTKRRHSQHQRMASIPENAFPRAELGLPIVFHFKDQGEPPDTVLYPAAGPEGKRERMASPLIHKPLALQNGKFVPLILRLKTLPLEAVDLRQGEQSLPLPTPTLIRGANLAQYPNSPLENRSDNGSAIEAFLACAESQGFTEVTR